ncbi:MAG: TauD/TfdA family dioxygenase [Acidiferrobacteraceae bacterium]
MIRGRDDGLKTDTARASPFLLGNKTQYARWRALKLSDYPSGAEKLIVEVRDPAQPTSSERDALLRIVGKTNMVIYRITQQTQDKQSVCAVAKHLGLVHLVHNPFADEDDITTLKVAPEKAARGYIPFTDKRLLWHTDGYYNAPEERIGAFVLHCVVPATHGGDNTLLDPEMVYLRLRDANPDYVRALMEKDVLTIPANIESGVEIRPARVGPVFAVDGTTGVLTMRYTARTRSARWKQDEATADAVRMLANLMRDDAPDVFNYRLGPGEGIACNNVLHSRSAFTQLATGPCRTLYRARYYERIASLREGLM